ncbi:hypothetical protein ACIP5Y_42640 [Nocardia sp. NPDC088792]|uniref:hypothetical protein n=1 Tax=Nocardia sp. NPDC088792 TaxID=3364332 RepID=UPI0037FEE8BE
MGFAAPQDSSTATAIRRRGRAWALILLGLVSVLAMLLALLVFAIHKVTGVAVGSDVVATSMSDSQAKEELAKKFHIHIPDSWHLMHMTSSCRVGVTLNTCGFDGSFTGPASEFGLYPSLFQARPPETVDQPAAQPVTCDGLAAKHLLELASDLDCGAQQHLVLSEFTTASMPTTGDVLVAGSATTTTVRISLELL